MMSLESRMGASKIKIMQGLEENYVKNMCS